MSAEATAATILVLCDEAQQKWESTIGAFPRHLEQLLDAVRVQVVPDKFGPVPIPGDPKYVGLPGFVKDRVRREVSAALGKLTDLVFDLIEIWRTLASHVGRPTLLVSASATIKSQVLPKAKGLDSALDGTPLLAANDGAVWDSPAADSYSEAFRIFSKQTGSIGKSAGLLADALQDAADVIEEYYVALKKAVFYGTLSFVGFALSLVTVETGPFVIVGLIIGFIGAIGTLHSMYDLEQGTTNAQAKIVGRLHGSAELKWDRTAFGS